MRNPHELSAPFVLDPTYSRAERKPAAGPSSIYGDAGRGEGAPWLYAAGDVAVFLMGRARRQAFREVRNIFHPGYFRPSHSCVLFRLEFSGAPPWAGPFAFHHSGEARLVVNGHFIQWWPHPEAPREQIVEIGSHLDAGRNELLFTLSGQGFPVALRAPGAWRCSADSQTWEEPEPLSYMGETCFPHHEKLPTIAVPARGREGMLYDFGVELIGTVRVPGTTQALRFRPGESVAEACAPPAPTDEQPWLEVAETGSAEAAFRYLRLTQKDTPPEPSGLICDLAVHPAAYRGAFACSDRVATQVWMHAAYTLRLCLRDVTVDGLKRDRLPWVGDLYLGLVGNAFAFGEHGLFRRTLMAFYHDYPDVADFSGIFDYTLYWVVAAGRHVLYAQDELGARLLWPRVRRVLATLERRLTPEGFLSSEGAAWLFLDWTDLPKTGLVLMVQSLYLQALEGAAGLAEFAGEPDAAKALVRQAALLRQRTAERFWSAAEARFADAWSGELSPHGSLHANAFAVLGGIGSPSQWQQALASAVADSAAAKPATPYMKYFACAAQARAGQVEAMLREVRGYWGGMLEAGATTFWEAYDATKPGADQLDFYGRPFGKSLCHAWAAGPVALYSSELFGMHPTAPGWRNFTFSPALGSLEWATTCVPTPYADIRAEVEGSSARLEIPTQCALPGFGIVAAEEPRQVEFYQGQDGWVVARKGI